MYTLPKTKAKVDLVGPDVEISKEAKMRTRARNTTEDVDGI